MMEKRAGERFDKISIGGRNSIRIAKICESNF